MTCDGKDIDARRGRYRPKEEGVSYEKVERILSEKGGEIVRKKRGNCLKKEGKLYEKRGDILQKVERISCDAQSGEDSDRLERKVDDLKSTKLQLE